MYGILPCVVGLAPILFGACGAPEIGPAEFQGWFDTALAGRLVIPAEVARGAQNHRYVFVAGFANERMPGYFAQNIKELRANGVPRSSIHVVSPSSHRSIDENADEVRDRLFAIAAEGPEPLVVIAHSRGACDALAFALREPGFVRDRIHALFLVQGPFGGTAVADLVCGDGLSLAQMPIRLRMIANLLVGGEKWYIHRGNHGGMQEMTRESSRAYWAHARETYADALPTVGPKVFYVTSATATTKLRLFKKATASYLGIHIGENDGLVAPDDQSLPGIGRVLAVLDVGHSDLTNRFPSSRAKPRLRRALIRAIIMSIGSDPTDDSGQITPDRVVRRSRLARWIRDRRR